MGNLFRKEAVENYKEQFSTDRQILKLSFSTSLIILMFIVVFLFISVWFVFGNIVNTVNVTGVVYPTAGIANITATNAGIISEITVNIGDDVEIGDIVAIIPDENILKKIDEAISKGENKEVIERLRNDYHNKSVVISKYEGKVISTYSDGDCVQAGDSIVSITAKRRDSNQRQIYAFLPTSQKNNISKGCAVQVSPNYAPREKFGYINGYVVDIGKTIITKSDVEDNSNVYNIPSILDENETYIAVYINLLSDSENESGLDWSEKNSGNIDVETGTICNASIVVSHNPPYKWLLGGGA